MTPENRNNYQSLIHQARRTDIAEWLQQNKPGIELRRVGQWWEIVGHDSLRIQNNRWYRNSQDRGGNAVDFLVDFFEMNAKDAIIALTGVDLTSGKKIIQKPNANGVKKENDKKLPTLESAREFDFSFIELSKDQRRVIAYLTKNRGIAVDIVLDEIKNSRLFQEIDTGNAIFAMVDETGVIIGAEAVGTMSFEARRFKGIKTGSKYGYGYNTGERAEPRYILYFESAVDMLSFITIERQCQKSLAGCLLVSMAGLKAAIVTKTLEVFGKSAAQPVLCVDNDSAGSRFIADIFLKHPDVMLHQPDKNYKDWNDQLLGKKLES